MLQQTSIIGFLTFLLTVCHIALVTSHDEQEKQQIAAGQSGHHV